MPGDSTHNTLDLLFAHLDQRLGRIEASIDRLAESHDSRSRSVELRVAALELKSASQSDGMRMLLGVAGGAATVGGIVAHLVGKIWQ
jgi:hypothetical protein